MTFCSPLAVTDFFEWSDTDAVTMMGDPVSSVYGGGICLAQLQNHMTRNLQKMIPRKDLDSPELMSEEARVNDAIDSICNRFAVVRVVEHLDETIEKMSFTFRWLKEELENSIDGVDRKCSFPHANGSPSNNRCECWNSLGFSSLLKKHELRLRGTTNWILKFIKLLCSRLSRKG